MQKTAEKETVWSSTQVQFLYRHRNGRYYVRTFSGGKEKWTSLKTKLLTVARNRMKDHVDAAERQRTTGNTSEAVGRLTFGEAITTYREQLQEAAVRPNTKAYREAGLKLVLRSWENVEALNVRRITSKMVEEWLRRFKAMREAIFRVLAAQRTPATSSTARGARKRARRTPAHNAVIARLPVTRRFSPDTRPEACAVAKRLLNAAAMVGWRECAGCKKELPEECFRGGPPLPGMRKGGGLPHCARHYCRPSGTMGQRIDCPVALNRASPAKLYAAEIPHRAHGRHRHTGCRDNVIHALIPFPIQRRILEEQGVVLRRDGPL